MCVAFIFRALLYSSAECRNLKTYPAKDSQVTYGIENLGEGNIVLKTNGAFAIAAPRIQFLPSQTGLSMMIADFDGLVWPYPARMIRLTNRQNGASNGAPGNSIDYINLAEMQNPPPVFRITVGAHNPDAFKSLSFQTTAGSLTLSWIPENTSGPETAGRTQYPHQSEQSDLGTGLSSGETGLKLAFTSESLGAYLEREPQATTEATAASTRQLSQDPSLVPITPPSLNFTESGPTKLEIKCQNKVAFKSFRLREPERFVVDFENLPGLSLATIPTPGDNDFVKAIRTSTAKGKNVRLVCDLAGKSTTVTAQLSNDGNILSLLFKQGLETQSIPPGVTVILDAGHGGSDPGAQRNNLQEKDMTLPIVLRLKEKLETHGIKVLLTRNDDTFVSLEDRVRVTNRVSPDLFLSVHINSLYSDRDLNGIETYYQTPQSKTLAECVHESLVNHLDASDRSVRKARFYVINHTAVPAVLAEVGFISCKEEREKLSSADYQKRIARALEHGVMLYLTKQIEAPEGQRLAVSLPKKEQDTSSLTTDSEQLAKKGLPSEPDIR